MESNVQDLVPSVSIDAIIMRRDAMVAQLTTAHHALKSAEALAEAMFGPERGYRLALVNYSSRREFTTDEGIAEMVREVDGRAWAFLLKESGLQTFLDASARAQWDQAIDKNDVPPLTRENIEATFSTLYSARGEMFERGVVEVFRALSWDFKTNTPIKFGKRIILRHVICSYGYPEVRGTDKLDDLVRVFSVLDGKPEPDHRNGMYRRLADRDKSTGITEADYFQIRTFKNGNGHLTFKRPDLVDKMNGILAKHHPNALAAAQ